MKFSQSFLSAAVVTTRAAATYNQTKFDQAFPFTPSDVSNHIHSFNFDTFTEGYVGLYSTGYLISENPINEIPSPESLTAHPTKSWSLQSTNSVEVLLWMVQILK